MVITFFPLKISSSKCLLLKFQISKFTDVIGNAESLISYSFDGKCVGIIDGSLVSSDESCSATYFHCSQNPELPINCTVFLKFNFSFK